MIIPTATMIIVQIIAVGCIIWTTPEPCPRKYRVTQEKGGILVKPTGIHRYCELDYGGKFILKDKWKDK